MRISRENEDNGKRELIFLVLITRSYMDSIRKDFLVALDRPSNFIVPLPGPSKYFFKTQSVFKSMFPFFWEAGGCLVANITCMHVSVPLTVIHFVHVIYTCMYWAKIVFLSSKG